MAFKIKIICFGTKRDSFQDELERYQKMLKTFAPLDIDYIKPLSASIENKEVCLKKEMKLIEQKIPQNSFVVVLGEEGKIIGDSLDFSKWVGVRKISAIPLIFIMGSAYGVSRELKKKSNFLMSLTPLTLPYSLCLVVLVEQLYRAYTILSKHPYHK